MDAPTKMAAARTRLILDKPFLGALALRLPLVEAMQRGLPVMASYIEVFREVGEDFCAYFDTAHIESLSELIQEFEQTNQFPAIRQLDLYKWLSWRESTEQFYAKLMSETGGTYR